MTRNIVATEGRRPMGDGQLARRARAAWVLVLAAVRDPRRRVFVVALVVALALVPVALFPRNLPIYAGIATSRPTVYTYTIGVLVTAGVLLATAWRRFLGALLPWLPFFVWLLAMGVFAWDPSPRSLSGMLHLCLGALSFAIGFAARGLDRFGSVLPWTFAVAAWLQLLAVGLAVVGLPLRRITGPQSLDILGRATGLTSHPGELAKLMFCCAVCALALPQRTRGERWAFWLTLGAVLAGMSLSESRSGLAAVVSAIVIFVLLDRVAGRWQRQHFVMIGTVLVLAVASLPWLVARFVSDPAGGARDHVMQVAGRLIREHPFVGVGPNNYVAVAGTFDRLTQTGVPVHNIFLLSAGELGIAGAVFLWLPFGLIAGRAVYRVWRSRGVDPSARVVASALPGFVLIGMTGWGLLQGQGFLMLALVFGYFGAHILGPRATPGGSPYEVGTDGSD
jgi:O-antigen ligase